MSKQYNLAAITILAAMILIIPGLAWAQSDDTSTAKGAEQAESQTLKTETPDPANQETRAAVVNGTVITRQQLDTETKAMGQRMAQGGKPIPQDQLATLRSRALDSIIERELLYQETVKAKIVADPEQAEKRFAALIQRFGDEAKYKENIQAMGLTEEGIQEMIRRSLAIETFVQTKVTADIKVTEEEKKAFYDDNPNFFKKPEQIKASHILIKLDENADEETQAKTLKDIEAVQEKVKAGDDFAELAKTHSQGPSGPNGGDLGFFGKGQMVKPFEEAALALKAGEVSDIVKTRFGYHIIKLNERRDPSVQPYDEAAGKIGQYLNQQKSKETFDTFLDGLKTSAKIEKFI